ncbi:hypothetical protein BS47DRAFT_1482932 [Hydnum rufescens UP504]|uniref:INO80 complex subunit B-like conserved region domain-containing protein n=1 Tax=Hydnum rufescens UP504 TaxID=1448309 RepID=A0A9P6DWZ8_9AGAM|nr:hypothetical protein BS47DRAFT_1482932 [Hydnum rufescens UP504]
MEEDELDELENDSRSVQSSSRMTARQAAIASGFDTEHVQLTVTPSKKKKHLNEAELLARRNETAIKRRHQTEKKLEDDKTETINRLLKKQSAGTRRKRALEESQSAASAAAAAAALAQNSDDQQRHLSSTGTGTVTGYATASDEAQKKPKVPCFRWISTSRPLRMKVAVEPKEPEGGGDASIKEKGAATQVPNVRFSFSIPQEFLPAVPTPPAGPGPSLLMLNWVPQGWETHHRQRGLQRADLSRT